MEIYQKTLVLILFMKNYQTGLRSVYKAHANTKWIPIRNADEFQERIHISSTYSNTNEKEWEHIMFDTRQLFDRCQNFMNLRHPRPNWTHATHAIYLADSTTRNEISDEVEKHAKPEITLNKLKSRNDIIITNVDKRGDTVIMVVKYSVR